MRGLMGPSVTLNKLLPLPLTLQINFHNVCPITGILVLCETRMPSLGVDGPWSLHILFPSLAVTNCSAQWQLEEFLSEDLFFRFL